MSKQLVDEGELRISPDGSSAMMQFRLHDDAGAVITRLACYNWALLNYPRGQSLPDFDGLRVVDYGISRLSNDTHGFIWVVRVNFTLREVELYPWYDTPEWNIVARSYEREIFTDASTPAQPIVNSAGDTFENQPTSLYVEPEIWYTRNENPSSGVYELVREQLLAASDPGEYCNTDSFTICRIGGANGIIIPPEKSLMRIENVQRMKRDDVDFVRVQYVFRLFPGQPASELRIVSMGYNELVGGTGDPVPVKIRGEYPRQPVALQADGSFSAGDPAAILTFQRPVTLVPFGPYGFV